MKKFSNYFLVLTYFNFFIFFFFPSHSFYSLMLLFLWLCYAVVKDSIKVRKSAYFYFSGLFFVFLLFSIILNRKWDSFGIFLPFLIPLAFLFFVRLIKIRHYSKGLLFLCLAFLLVHNHSIFLSKVYFDDFINQINFSQVLAICVIFIPIFWSGLLEKNIFWKLVQLIFVVGLFLTIFSQLQLLFLFFGIYALLLFCGIWLRRKVYYYVILGYWPVLFFVLFIIVNSFSVNQNVFFLQIQELQNLTQVGLIENFSLLGRGYWVSNTNNTYSQLYLSFGFLGLLGFLVLATTFVIALFFTMRRKITIDTTDTKILWSYSCSIILFFVMLLFYSNFINSSIFYFIMAIWGVALGYVDSVRSYKKKRV